MVTMWKAQVRVVPAGGFVQVRRQGETTNRTVACARHVSTAQVNEWVQIIEAEGQPVAIALLGTGPTVVPPNPDPGPGGGGGPATITVPVAWTGSRKWTPYNGNTPAGFEHGFWWGRKSSAYWGNLRAEAMAIYTGLKGVPATAASVQFAPGFLNDNTKTTDNRLALWLAPDVQPAEQSSGHPAGISLVADQLLGVAWPAVDTITVAIPSAWLAHLIAGTANGIGIVNNTMAPVTGVWAYGASPRSMTVTYE